MNKVARFKPNWALYGIFLLGLALRMWGVHFALPFLYDPDESVILNIAAKILHTGNLNPNFFDWPSLSIYFYTLVHFAYFVFGRLTGQFTTPGDIAFPDVETMAVGRSLNPDAVLLSRGLTALVGALGIFTVYLICRRMSGGNKTALLAALLFAVEPVDIQYSHILRPETFVIFFALWSFYFTLKSLDEPRVKNFLLAGAAAGLAASSKYNAALIIIPLVVVYWIRFGFRGFLQKPIWMVAVAAAVSFILTTPYALFDLPQFLRIGPAEVAAHYSSGHPGAEGNSLQWYLLVLWNSQGVSLLLALGYLLSAIFRRSPRAVVLLVFPVVYLAFISLYVVHFAATVLPVIPFLLIAASLFVEPLAVQLGPRLPALARGPALAIFVLVLALPPLHTSSVNDLRLSLPDGRDQAQQWINAHLAPGTRIALEAYSPYVDRSNFVVDGLSGLQDHSPEWYVSQGYEYLVFSSGIFGRYFDNPTVYAPEVQRYNALFSAFAPVARFVDNGIDVRIYSTGVDLPAHRVGVRFVDSRNLIELVGYDAADRIDPGQDLRVKLVWRTLRGEKAPCELELGFLDSQDTEIASTRGDLFQGRGWADGLFSGEWTIRVPSGAAPGLYRISVRLLETAFNYYPSVMDGADRQIDDLTLGPMYIRATPPSVQEIRSAHAAVLHFGQEIALVGYETPDRALPAGGVLPVTLYWQALAKLRDYTVFVHLLDSEGKLCAQMDSAPRAGTYPTSAWDLDEIVRDDYFLALPSGLKPGTYSIEIGYYELSTGKRLRVADASGQGLGDHWVMPSPVTITR